MRELTAAELLLVSGGSPTDPTSDWNDENGVHDSISSGGGGGHSFTFTTPNGVQVTVGSMNGNSITETHGTNQPSTPSGFQGATNSSVDPNGGAGGGVTVTIPIH
jgi:hypothetical protein